jgi:hypothetical protein
MHSQHRFMSLRFVLVVLGLLILLPLTLSNTACTLIGLAIGVAGSADAPPERMPARSVFKVSPGAPISITTKDQKEYSGVYLGRRSIEDSSYASRYEAWGVASPRAPALGGGVEIELQDGARVRGTFDGFTYRAARVIVDPTIGPETIAFKRVRSMQADSLERWTGDELARLDAAGDLPSREAVCLGIVRPFSWSWRRSSSITEPGLESGDYPEQVVLPTDRITAILVRGRTAAPLVLGLVGLGIDILIVRSINEDLSHPKCADSGTYPPLLSQLEHSADEFDTRAGEFVPPALAAAGSDSLSATQGR